LLKLKSPSDTADPAHPSYVSVTTLYPLGHDLHVTRTQGKQNPKMRKYQMRERLFGGVKVLKRITEAASQVLRPQVCNITPSKIFFLKKNIHDVSS
jgi:hypothetical protein